MASLTQWRRPPTPVPYGEDHVYTVVGTGDRAIAAKLQVYSSVGYDGTCASSSYTCSGEFTVKIYGPPQEQGKVQTVSFLFTQGGWPKVAPRDLIDVRTAGRGSITFVNHDPDEPERVQFDKIKKGTAQLSFRTSRSLFLPPPFGLVGGSDREGFEFTHECV